MRFHALLSLPFVLLGGCSPDGSRIATLSAATTNRSAPYDSVRTRRILVDSQTIDFMDGSVSRDGRFVTGYDAATGNLAIRDLRSDEQRLLTRSGDWQKGDNALTTRISPDGRMVAFLWSFGPPSYAFELRVVGTDGSREHVLRKGNSIASTVIGDWTPDSRQIVVSASSDGNDRQIALMSVADGSVRAIKSVGWRYPFTMRVSPDGRRVAYAIALERGSSDRDIYVLDLDGTREIRLTRDTQPKDVLGWSEDGRTLYYQTRNNDAATVWRVGVSDRSPTPAPHMVRSDIWGLTRLALNNGTLYYAVTTRQAAIYSLAVDFESGRVTAPSSVVAAGENVSMVGRVAWSPDGRRIAFVRDGLTTGAPPSAIVFRDVRSGEEQQIPVALNGVQLLDWSADSRSLVVAGYDRGVQSRYQLDLSTGKASFIDRLVGDHEIPPASPSNRRDYIVRMDSAADSVALVVLESGTARESVVLREKRIYRAVLSPDGKYVGVVGTPYGDGRSAYVAIVPVAGGPPRIVYRSPQPRGLGSQLDWTPDSRFLAFVEHDSKAGVAELWKVAANADSAERVTRLAGESPAYARISPDGHHVGYVSLVGANVRELWAMENLPASGRPDDRP